MRPYRNLKMASLIREELSNLFLREFDFDGVLVTIPEVIIGEELDTAIVKLSVIPFEKEPEIFLTVDKRRRELEHKLLKKINIRPMPHLKFRVESHKNNEEVLE